VSVAQHQSKMRSTAGADAGTWEASHLLLRRHRIRSLGAAGVRPCSPTPDQDRDIRASGPARAAAVGEPSAHPARRRSSQSHAAGPELAQPSETGGLTVTPP